jgi:hypothetical protein
MGCNPAINWVKWKWIKTKKGVPVRLEPFQRFCPLSLDANPNKQFADKYRLQLEKLEGADKSRLLYGNWDAVDNERPWFHSFDKSVHIKSGTYVVDELEPIHLSFDFNIEPMTCSAGQYVPNRGLSVFRAHAIEGTSHTMVEELKKFGYQDHVGGLIITGDVSGKARHTSSGVSKFGDISTDYSIIKEGFNLTNRQIVHTGKQNPRLKYSRRLINHAFTKGVVMIYEDDCAELVEDVKSAIANPDDTLLKTADNGMHFADNLRYLIHMIFKNGFKDVNNAAELVNFTQSTPAQSSVQVVPDRQSESDLFKIVPSTSRHRQRR